MKNLQDVDKQICMMLENMLENMLKINGQMRQIIDRKNPEERERLVQEHTQIMQQHRQSLVDFGLMGGDV